MHNAVSTLHNREMLSVTVSQLRGVLDRNTTCVISNGLRGILDRNTICVISTGLRGVLDTPRARQVRTLGLKGAYRGI